MGLTTKEPISPTDALFLIGESREHPMHVGSLQLFAPPEDAGPHLVRESNQAMLECTDVQPTFRKHPAFFGGRSSNCPRFNSLPRRRSTSGDCSSG
jgi:hypothetical protein